MQCTVTLLFIISYPVRDVLFLLYGLYRKCSAQLIFKWQLINLHCDNSLWMILWLTPYCQPIEFLFLYSVYHRFLLQLIVSSSYKPEGIAMKILMPYDECQGGCHRQSHKNLPCLWAVFGQVGCWMQKGERCEMGQVVMYSRSLGDTLLLALLQLLFCIG